MQPMPTIPVTIRHRSHQLSNDPPVLQVILIGLCQLGSEATWAEKKGTMLGVTKKCECWGSLKGSRVSGSFVSIWANSYYVYIYDIQVYIYIDIDSQTSNTHFFLCFSWVFSDDSPYPSFMLMSWRGHGSLLATSSSCRGDITLKGLTLIWFQRLPLIEYHLVGGLNPSEKYES